MQQQIGDRNIGLARIPRDTGRPVHSQRKSSLTLAGLRSAAFQETLIIIGLAGWIIFGVAFAGSRPAVDWMTFYTGAKLYFEGRLDLLFNGFSFTALQNANFSTWLAHPIPFQPWVYPPSFLLLLLPFGLLPFWASYTAFMLLSLCGLAVAVWAHAANHSQRRYLRLYLYVSLILCPAMAMDVFVGQNGLLTCALLLGGFAAVPSYPVLGGVLLGLLSFKPQLWLMVPVALIGGRHLKVLISAVVTAGVLTMASLALFGLQCWVRWLEFATGHDNLYRTWVIENRVHGESVFASAVAFGAPMYVASAIQGGAIMLAAGCIYWAFRKPMPPDIRLIILFSLTIFASPHLLTYDMLPLDLAAAILFVRAKNEGYSGVKLVSAVTWISPLCGVFVISGAAVPIVIIVFNGYLLYTYARRQSDRPDVTKHALISSTFVTAQPTDSTDCPRSVAVIA